MRKADRHFVEFGDIRVIDEGHGKGWSVERWIQDKKESTHGAGEWKVIYHANNRKSIFAYLGKITDRIEDHIEKEEAND